jgi:anthranilate synthase component 2/para-aminobenzoate synthetase component 2
MILVIDNYDSFVYNLVQYIGEWYNNIKVVRNNKITISEIEKLNPTHIIISPGPCTPNESGISIDVIKKFYTKIPILGVCLGHQCIVQAFGGKVIRAKRIMHGKVSQIFHDKKTIYKNIPNPFIATRYHSLIADNKSLPECLKITAWTNRNEIMGVRLKISGTVVEGVQFHPESILTKEGKKLLKNFFELKKI